MIRLDPEHLPLGKVNVLPGLFFTRLKHEDLKPLEATISKKAEEGVFIYEIAFPQRTLSIEVEETFPYKILGWKEQFSERGQSYQTTAKLDKTLYTDYWRKNGTEFNYLRDSLGLSRNNY